MAGIMPMLRNTRAFKKQPQLRLELLYNFVCLILKPYIIFYLSSVPSALYIMLYSYKPYLLTDCVP